MKLILLGIQGSGKSTQGTLLHKKLGIPYLSTGHIFRVLAKEHTQLGRYIKEIMNAGYLIPDRKVLNIVSEYLSRPEYQKGYILDGFPRTVKQAETFSNGIDRVIYLNVSDKEALWRLSYRLSDDGREDDTLQAIRKRIEVYHKFTDPVLEYYRKKGVLVEINGEQSISRIYKEILQNLEPIANKRLLRHPSKKKTVIAIVGMAGSGKTEAASYFSGKGIPVIRFGSVIIDGLQKENMDINAENEQNYREKIRKEHGMSGVAKKLLPAINDILKTNDKIILDGLYSWEEYLYLQKEIPSLVILCIYARPSVRHRRLKDRKERQFTVEEARTRDIAEIENLHKGGPIAFADYLIKNETTKEDLHLELEKFRVAMETL